MHQVGFEYPTTGKPNEKRMLIYEERLWATNDPPTCDRGVEFCGTQGQMYLSHRGKIQVLLDRNQKKVVEIPLEPQNTEAHC